MPDKKKNIGKRTPKKDSNIPKGTNYLLTIGIDDYAHCPKLYNAVKDTRDIANILLEKYDFEEKNHISLENKNATKRNIINHFRELKNKLTTKDNLLIYYSGHGELDKDFDESHWVTVESEKGEVSDYLPTDRLVKMIRAIKTHHTLMIIDACFAGGWLVNQRSINALETDPSRYVIASGRNEYASDGQAGKNSPFATALIEKLKKNQESLSAIGLAEYVKIQTIKATRKTQRPIHNPLQIPEDKGGEFIFHPKKMGEESIWESTLSINTIHAFDDYLEKFPNGKYADEAEEEMEAIEHEETWIKIKRNNSLVSYRKYLRRYSKGKYRAEAQAAIQKIKTEEEEIVEFIEETSSVETEIAEPISEFPNLFTDSRDGQIYEIAQLEDGNIWMTSNFNFDIGNGCHHYNDDAKNGKKYGKLYDWDAAVKACPEGWRLPTRKEWSKLIDIYREKNKDFKKDENLFIHSLLENGSSLLELVLGGFKSQDYYGLDEFGAYWTATDIDEDQAWDFTIDKKENEITYEIELKMSAFSCRYIKILGKEKDSEKKAFATKKSKPKIIQPTQHIIKDNNVFTDPRDGQEYKTVKLKDGNIWMAQNLNFDVGEGCWHYDNDLIHEERFGRLYTWDAAQKACPKGWQIPSNKDWSEMTEYYGGRYFQSDGKRAYKELLVGEQSKFFALLGGQRRNNGSFYELDLYGYYWSSNEFGNFYFWYFDKPRNRLDRSAGSKLIGLSCRCVLK